MRQLALLLVLASCAPMRPPAAPPQLQLDTRRVQQLDSLTARTWPPNPALFRP